MPKLYQITLTRSTVVIDVVAPDDFTEAAVRALVDKRAEGLFDRHSDRTVIAIGPPEDLTIQEAADRSQDAPEYRVKDSRAGLVYQEEVDWIEGVIRENP